MTMDQEDITVIEPSKIETIDFALFEWVDKEMNLHTTTNKGFVKIPVIWVSGERSFQVKNRKELRDSEGSLIFPIITVERTAINKDPSRRGTLQAYMPPINKHNNFNYHIRSRIKQSKTSPFASSNSQNSYGQDNFRFKNDNVVYEDMYIKTPTYMDVSYTITVRSEYQQQMNEVIHPFLTKTGNINGFYLKKDGHQYEAFLQSDFSFSNNISSMEQEERIYQTAISVNVLGYLYGSDVNDDEPKVYKEESTAKIKITGEREILSESATKKV